MGEYQRARREGMHVCKEICLRLMGDPETLPKVISSFIQKSNVFQHLEEQWNQHWVMLLNLCICYMPVSVHASVNSSCPLTLVPEAESLSRVEEKLCC